MSSTFERRPSLRASASDAADAQQQERASDPPRRACAWGLAQRAGVRSACRLLQFRWSLRSSNSACRGLPLPALRRRCARPVGREQAARSSSSSIRRCRYGCLRRLAASDALPIVLRCHLATASAESLQVAVQYTPLTAPARAAGSGCASAACSWAEGKPRPRGSGAPGGRRSAAAAAGAAAPRWGGTSRRARDSSAQSRLTRK